MPLDSEVHKHFSVVPIRSPLDEKEWLDLGDIGYFPSCSWKTRGRWSWYFHSPISVRCWLNPSRLISCELVSLNSSPYSRGQEFSGIFQNGSSSLLSARITRGFLLKNIYSENLGDLQEAELSRAWVPSYLHGWVPWSIWLSDCPHWDANYSVIFLTSHWCPRGLQFMGFCFRKL